MNTSRRRDGSLVRPQESSGEKTVGVVMVGLPVSQELAKREKQTCEVRRVATDGTGNACSFFYARARDASFVRWVLRESSPIFWSTSQEPSLRAAGSRICRHDRWRFRGTGQEDRAKIMHRCAVNKFGNGDAHEPPPKRQSRSGRRLSGDGSQYIVRLDMERSPFSSPESATAGARLGARGGRDERTRN